MKKFLLIPLFFTAIFFSCNKVNKHDISTDVVNLNKPYSFSNGLLKFNSTESYQKFLEEASEADKQTLINDAANRTDYKPLYKSDKLLAQQQANNNSNRLVSSGNTDVDDQINELLTASVLSSMINADGLVQIGNYIFNIDILNEKCYAMHASYLSGSNASYYYGLILNAQTNNNFVIQFTTDNSVLELLTLANNPTTVSQYNTSGVTDLSFCGEGAVAHRVHSGKEYFSKVKPGDRDHYLDCKVAYDKAGIYFALYGKVDYKPSIWHWNTRRDWYYWKFKPKCWSERFQSYTTTYSTNQANGYKRFAWESTRALTKYDITFQWEILGGSESNQLLKTSVYAIKAGY